MSSRCNDSSIYEQSILRNEISNNPILKEKYEVLNGIKVLVILIGDSAFRLSDSMMKPYAFQVNTARKLKLFNYTISKSRRECRCR